jgi:hypothetical protein
MTIRYLVTSRRRKRKGRVDMWQSKTVWVAMAGILTAVGSYVAGEIDLLALGGSIWAGLLAIFLRDKLQKIGSGS